MLYLESPPPSVWKASGLDPSFMNFMAEAEMKNKYQMLSSALLLSLSLFLSLTTTSLQLSSAQCVCVCARSLLTSHVSFASSCLLFLSRKQQKRREEDQESKQLSPKKHTRAQRERREREMVWFGEERGGGINSASLLRSGYYAGVGGSSSCVAWSFLFSKFSVELVAGERFSSLS